MSELYHPTSHATQGSVSAIQTMEQYQEVWNRSTAERDAFWLEKTKAMVDWKTEPTIGLEGDFHTVQQSPFRWFSDGTLNITTSCLDRHIADRGDKVAILWEGDEPDQIQRLTYTELLVEVCKLGQCAEGERCRKGDRVIIYMGMIPTSRHCDAGLCSNRSSTFGGLWWIQFQCTSRPD